MLVGKSGERFTVRTWTTLVIFPQSLRRHQNKKLQSNRTHSHLLVEGKAG